MQAYKYVHPILSHLPGVQWGAVRALFAALIASLFLGSNLLLPASPAEAQETNRFGPPWIGVVKVDNVVAYTRASRDSAPSGPLGKGAKVPVLGRAEGGAGPDGDTTWYQTPVGYLPSAQVDEYRDPWVAEVVRDGVPVYARAMAASGVRRTANKGDLLRVTGVSAGLAGDRRYYYATTAGFVPLDSIRESTSLAARAWQLPMASLAPTGWWGQVTGNANVRVVASTASPIVGRLSAGQKVKVLREEQGQSVNGNATWYLIDGGRYAGARVHSSLIERATQPQANTAPLRGGDGGSLYINVDRRTSTLTVVQNGQAVFVTYVSLGRAGKDTPRGLYSTFGKLRHDDMRSSTVVNPTAPYDLPNVPDTQYYKDGGYALHGTYWHDGFGTDQSQGCINVTVTDGAYLFGLTSPRLPAGGQNEVWNQNGEATALQILN